MTEVLFGREWQAYFPDSWGDPVPMGIFGGHGGAGSWGKIW